MRNVLSVTSECVPLIKTGGLADVAGALPSALAEHGWGMRTLMPAYSGLIAKAAAKKVLWQSDDLFGGSARVLQGLCGGNVMLLLDAPHLYERAGGAYGNPTDFADNPQRFAALSYMAAEIARGVLTDGWRPEVVHAHDWQAGLTATYLKQKNPYGVGTVMTVHNIAFQGLAPAALLGSLNLPLSSFTPDELEYWGQISTLKAGLVHSDVITTVSPTYAAELMRPEFGMGLEGVLATRAGDLSGILNGIDMDVWSPEADPEITSYSAKSLAGKKKNKQALLADFGLAKTDGPLAIVVSRLTSQKGMDLIAGAAPEFIANGGALAILGSGDPDIEDALRLLARDFAGKVGLRIGYDEALSHRMFAGGDVVLVPSRFEPCGLTQLYGLRYGTVPVVAATGGLADSVVDHNLAAAQMGVSTGFQFHPIDQISLSHCLRGVIAAYSNKSGWTRLQKRGMNQDLGWGASSATYAALYERVAK
ncbi:starch synthase [Pacificibacter maritimus]|uniref:Glycogen synthase n=1 Tax=Pacificibacter maritimus TaxID=762213 RepID=A0A3N4V0K2_9RHOB|nr:glycogen synthase GlgA [Pacificibacter maritimus]RPE66444.1 starch synthase [Pacificibacter maritimus]